MACSVLLRRRASDRAGNTDWQQTARYQFESNTKTLCLFLALSFDWCDWLLKAKKVQDWVHPNFTTSAAQGCTSAAEGTLEVTDVGTTLDKLSVRQLRVPGPLADDLCASLWQTSTKSRGVCSLCSWVPELYSATLLFAGEPSGWALTHTAAGWTSCRTKQQSEKH